MKKISIGYIRHINSFPPLPTLTIPSENEYIGIVTSIGVWKSGPNTSWLPAATKTEPLALTEVVTAIGDAKSGCWDLISGYREFQALEYLE